MSAAEGPPGQWGEAGAQQINVGPISINVSVPPGTGHDQAHAVAQAVSDPSIMRALTRALRTALITQGIPTQTPVAP